MADAGVRSLFWPGDAVLYAAHDFLIGPAIAALRGTALAIIARDRIDAGTYDLLVEPWRGAFADPTDSPEELTNRP